MELSEELMETVARVCQHVQQLILSYEEGREPEKLDCLVFHVDRLYRILLALNVTTEVLEAVGTSLRLLEELNRAQRSGESFGYTPSVVRENHRGRPKLDIKQEQLEYLLHLGFQCPKIADVMGVFGCVGLVVFGVDWEGPVPHENNEEITVPETPNPLNRADMEELERIVSPLQPSVHYGIDLYDRALLFLSQKVGCAL